jgi:hypothetical protein
LSFVKKLKSELGFKAAHPDSGWFKPYWQIKIARGGRSLPVEDSAQSVEPDDGSAKG